MFRIFLTVTLLNLVPLFAESPGETTFSYFLHDTLQTLEAHELDLLISHEEIQEKVKSFAKVIDERYAKQNLVIVGVLRGAICFMDDLIRELNTSYSIDFVKCRSYVDNQRGSLTIQGIEELNIKDKHVLILDDIFDSGKTLTAVWKAIQEENPASLKSVVLLQKNVPHLTDYRPDDSLFTIENRYVFGYGLDFHDHLRGLRSIYAFKE